MRITCEYCGALIDTEKASHNCCPNCGASFENNKQFQESNEQQKEFDQYMLEQERIETEEKRLRLEKQKQTLNFQKQNQNTVKAMRIGCIIPIFIVVGIIFLTVIGTMFDIFDTQKDMINNIQDEYEVNINEGKMYLDDEEKITVNFNEEAISQRAKVVINKCETYHYPYKKPPEGYVYVRVHFTVTNTFIESVYMFNEIYATYEIDDTIQEAETPTINSSDLGTKLKNGELRQGMSKQGWCYFTVPENTKFVVHCDNNVDIIIKPENILEGE